jgi:PST family polysaccharide transporter
MTPFDADGVFQLPAESGGLRRLAVRGAGMTVLSQSAGVALQMLATVVLARLLTPADFGVVAMVTAFSLLLMNFGLNGFTEAVIQRQRIDRALSSNLFWINVTMGIVLTLAFAASGSMLAGFYGDARVADVAAAMSLTILLTSLSVQHLALLKRGMCFSAVSANDMVARTASVAVSIVCGWAGWGYWALVAGAITLPLLTSAGAWMLCGWIPGLPRRAAGTASVLRFALNTYGRFTTNYLTLNLDNLLIGSMFGSAPLGFYKKAYDLFILPVNQLSAPLTSVAISALSRVRSDRLQYTRSLLNALSTLAFVGMGISGALTLAGADIILLLLGPRWDESGRIFAFFGPGVGILLLYFTHGWIHLSLGRADRWLRWGMIELAVAATFFVAALPWGPRGIAVAWVGAFAVLTIPALWYAGRPVCLSARSLVGAVGRYAIAGAIAGAVSASFLDRLRVLAPGADLVHTFIRIVMTAALFAAFYLCAVVVLHRGLAPLSQLARLLSELLPFRPPRSQEAGI